MRVVMESTGLLVNFTSEYVPFQLVGTARRQLTIERDIPVEDLDLWEYLDPHAHHELTDGVRYGLVDRLEVSPEDSHPESAEGGVAGTALRDALTAMRLVKSLWVGMPFVWVRVFDEGGAILFQDFTLQGWDLAQQHFWDDSSVCVFGKKDLSELKLIAERLNDYGYTAGREDGLRMRGAINRLNWAIDRERPEDKLLDLSIALEALFAVQGDSDAGRRIGDQIAERCCLYLESLRRDHPLLSKVNTWYRMRSIIVHGSESSDDLTAAIQGLGQITRRTIKKELLEPGSLAQLRAL